MRGHVRKHHGSYYVILSLGRDEQGKRRSKWERISGNKKDAEAILARRINELESGTYVRSDKITISEYFVVWLRDSAKHRVAAKTYERYEELIKKQIVPVLGKHILSKIRPGHIQAFYTQLLTSGRVNKKGGLSPRTVIHIHRVLRRALKQAVRWQLLAQNPADSVDVPKINKHRPVILSPAEVVPLLDAARGKRIFIPVLLALAGGLRRGEVLGLRWRDIDFENAQISVVQTLQETRAEGISFKQPKTERSSRTVRLPQFALDELRKYRKRQAEEKMRLGALWQNSDLVVTTHDGGPWRPCLVSGEFRNFATKVGIEKIRFHDLRHTHATLMLGLNVHAKVVSERLGHSSIGITMDTYSHVMPNMQRDAADALDGLIGPAFGSGQK